MAPSNVMVLPGPERFWCIAGLLLCVEQPIRFPLVLGTFVGSTVVDGCRSPAGSGHAPPAA